MITKNTKQYELITSDKTDTRSQVHAAKAAKAIRRRLLKQAQNMTSQDEIWVTRTDVMVINRVANILRLGTHKDPFHGGAAFDVNKMAVTAATLNSWLN